MESLTAPVPERSALAVTAAAPAHRPDLPPIRASARAPTHVPLTPSPLPMPPRREDGLLHARALAMAASAPPATADRVLPAFEGEFELGAEIGRGTYSIVYAARHCTTGAAVAVKIVDLARVSLTAAGSTAAYAPALNEVRILRALDHPGIIRVHGAYQGAHRGRRALFIVSELAPGGELFAALVSAVNFSEQQTRYVMWQALGAVAYMHAHGVVHRDLKLENVLIMTAATAVTPQTASPSPPGTADSMCDSAGGAGGAGSDCPASPMHHIKIADFGTARYLGAAAASTGAHSFVGSPQYVAPEVLFTHDAGGAASAAPATGYGCPVDVYALGVIAYVCLAGYLPFDVAAPSEPGRGVRHAPAATWEARARAGDYCFAPPVWTHISDAAKSAIRGMMALDPAARLTVAQTRAHPWFAPERAEAAAAVATGTEAPAGTTAASTASNAAPWSAGFSAVRDGAAAVRHNSDGSSSMASVTSTSVATESADSM